MYSTSLFRKNPGTQHLVAINTNSLLSTFKNQIWRQYQTRPITDYCVQRYHWRKHHAEVYFTTKTVDNTVYVTLWQGAVGSRATDTCWPRIEWFHQYTISFKNVNLHAYSNWSCEDENFLLKFVNLACVTTLCAYAETHAQQHKN